jgi:hypothetical protein
MVQEPAGSALVPKLTLSDVDPDKEHKEAEAPLPAPQPYWTDEDKDAG